MAKISIVIADSDVLYLNHLTNYLIANTHNFDVCSFTSKESLVKFIGDFSNRNKIDVIAFSEDFMDDAILASSAPAKIVLSDGSAAVSGCDCVNKYQKAEKFINDIVTIYAERSGNAGAMLTGDKDTKLVGFYSPVGGCGKTTLALATACALSKLGKKVFYFNAEKINSTTYALNSTQAGNLSDFYLTLKTKGASVGSKIISAKSVEMSSGISFISPGESSLEINEITTDEFEKLVLEMEALREFDYVIVDFDSEFNKEKITMLGYMDKIVLPFVAEGSSLAKMGVFFKEIEMYDELKDIGFKLVPVINKASAQSVGFIQGSGMLQGCDIKANIALNNGFSELKNVLHAGESLVSVMSAVVENI